MFYERLSGVLAAALCVALIAYAHARNQADRYLALFNAAIEELRYLDRTAVKRDPKTGRYLSKKGK